MKKMLILFLIPLTFIACTGGSSEKPTTAGNDSAVTAAVPLPYTADYSSNFVPGKQTDVATVLNSYKAWETNDMAALRACFGDTVSMEFPGGGTFKGPLDSLIKIARIYRDSLSKVSLTFYAWIPTHSVDKNEDWVSVWYKEVDTYKTGKMDSVEFEDDNQLKNGKIVFTSSHSRKLKK